VVRVLRTPAGHGHEEIQHFFLPASQRFVAQVVQRPREAAALCFEVICF